MDDVPHKRRILTATIQEEIILDFKDYIRVIPDFPQAGISFKDITTLLKNGEVYRKAIEELKVLVSDLKIDVIAGPEARGFVVGAPLAYALG